jgi:hypothetical protein
VRIRLDDARIGPNQARDLQMAYLTQLIEGTGIGLTHGLSQFLDGQRQ